MTATPGEAFVKLPRDLLKSDAWHSLTINARRFLDFLMIEHMARGGKANGRLIAPRRQLWDFGIGQRLVSAAIEDCERVGLVFCRRGVGRAPSLYTLAWLPLANGDKPPDGKWRAFRLETTEKSGLMVHEGYSLSMVHDGHSQNDKRALTKPVVVHEGHSQWPESRVHEGHSPSRKLLTTAKPKEGRRGRTARRAP